jgi:DNA-binding transcriptional ArsR family regulator
MSTPARARAAELLSQLSHPLRLSIVAELVRRAGDGRRPLLVAEIAAAVDVPIRDAANAVSRLQSLGLIERVEVEGVGQAYTARLPTLRDAAVDLDAENPVTELLADAPRLRGVFTHGRLVTLPDMSVHGRDLAVMLGRLIDFDGFVDEAEINRRLASVSDDVAQLRRLMVDEGVLLRDRAGTTYEMAPRSIWASPQWASRPAAHG